MYNLGTTPWWPSRPVRLTPGDGGPSVRWTDPRVGINAVYKRNITAPAGNRTPMLKQTRYDRRWLWTACMLGTRARPTALTSVFAMKAKTIFYCCTTLRNGRHHRLYAAMMSSALQRAIRAIKYTLSNSHHIPQMPSIITLSNKNDNM